MKSIATIGYARGHVKNAFDIIQFIVTILWPMCCGTSASTLLRLDPPQSPLPIFMFIFCYGFGGIIFFMIFVCQNLDYFLTPRRGVILTRKGRSTADPLTGFVGDAYSIAAQLGRSTLEATGSAKTFFQVLGIEKYKFAT